MAAVNFLQHVRHARVWRFVPALAWAGIIFGLSSRPLPVLLFAPWSGVDKVLHAGAYAVLAWLLLWGAAWPLGARALGWVLVAVVYGMTDEWHQSYVPGRSCDGWDLLADSVGAGMVLLWRSGWQRWRRVKAQ